MITLTFRPMPVDPGWKELGRHCSVRPNHSRAMAAIRYELSRIGATDVIIEAGFTASQIRQDGYPYSNASPSHSTVRIGFRRNGKESLSFTCGGHQDWVVNIYLIAKTLEALRAVDRYGCTKGAEQYKGWGQLPPGGAPISAAEWASAEDAARFILSTAGDDASNSGNVREVLGAQLDFAYRRAAKRAHPDAGGSDELMAKVNRAKDFVEVSMGKGAA